MDGLCFGRILTNITSLGPGKRTVIWFQGCRKNPKCPNCTSPDYWDFTTDKYIRVETCIDLLEGISDEGRLTISGGEPFDQPEALFSLLLYARNRYHDILLFSGKQYEEIVECFPRHMHLLDVLVDGPYQEKYDSGEVLRGSNNQRIWYFTDSQKLLDEYKNYIQNGRRKEELVVDNGMVFSIGIPVK